MKKEFYASLKERLSEGQAFPLLYMFKFIVPSDNKKIAQVNSAFNENAQISLKESSKGKFTSLTVKTVMLSADEVINKYRQLEHIEGLIAL